MIVTCTGCGHQWWDDLSWADEDVCRECYDEMERQDYMARIQQEADDDVQDDPIR